MATKNEMFAIAESKDCRYVIEIEGSFDIAKTKKEATEKAAEMKQLGHDVYVMDSKNPPKKMEFIVTEILEGGDPNSIGTFKNAHPAIKAWMKAYVKNPTMVSIIGDYDSKKELLWYARWNDFKAISDLAKSTGFDQALKVESFIDMLKRSFIGTSPILDAKLAKKIKDAPESACDAIYPFDMG